MTTLHANETETSELAAAAAHALNNVIAVLYAASSYLESPANPRSLERATRALGDACGSALRLSAALSLLALPPAGRLHVPAGGQEIRPEDLTRVLETLEAATNARSSGQDAVGEAVGEVSFILGLLRGGRVAREHAHEEFVDEALR